MPGCQVQVIWQNNRILGKVGELVEKTNDWWSVRFEDGSEHEYLPEHFQVFAASATGPAASALGPTVITAAEIFGEALRKMLADAASATRPTATSLVYFKGIKDPYRHDEPSLRAFLGLHTLFLGKCDYCNLRDDNYCGGCGSSLR